MRTVILAGGRGTRLRPYTTIFPKPLMPVGDMPILEIVIRQLKHAGITDIVMAVGHLAELLEAYFGDGSRLGVRIAYSREETPLGTAGPLALIPGLDETFLVMNGDVLTTIDYTALIAAHRRSGALATIATHRRDVRIDLGVIETDAAGRLTDYIEKPTYHYRVSMGIYIFEPAALGYIPQGQRFDFPELILRLLAAGQPVQSFPFDGYWLDIGRPDDYEQAIEEFERLKTQFLPEVVKEQRMDWQVPLSDIDLGDAEIEAVEKVLRSRWLSMGPVTQQFEAAFAAMCGAKHAFAVSNGTTALHLAYAALGLGPGDEVIVPALTFVATANAIRYTGATPVFADVTSLDDLTISPADIAAKITPRTRAIAVMHYGGYLCDMDAILALAGQHGLAVVEDACHAPGATYDGRGAGTLGDVGCFSFFANKNIAIGEGGMVTTNRDDLAERIRLLRSHGMTTLTWDRHRGHAASYDVVATGFNYRLDEIHSALGLAQLGKLLENNRRRADLVAHLPR